MVSVYPGWLGLRALDELRQVTIAGHVVHGAMLGWLARRTSAGLAVSTVDGLHLAVRPAIGLLSVPAALAGGFVVGARHPGFADVFTEPLWLLAGLAFLGAVSGTLGLYSRSVSRSACPSRRCRSPGSSRYSATSDDVPMSDIPPPRR